MVRTLHRARSWQGIDHEFHWGGVLPYTMQISLYCYPELFGVVLPVHFVDNHELVFHSNVSILGVISTT